MPVRIDLEAALRDRGVCEERGLYFVGLDFLYSFVSENVGGVGRDARHVARRIAAASAERAVSR